MNQLVKPNKLVKAFSELALKALAVESEFPSKTEVKNFAAKNKEGIPVTRASVEITLKDSKPAFNISTTLLGKTPQITSGIGGLGNAHVAILKAGNKSYVNIPGDGVRGNGGVLFLPPQGTNRIKMLVWNTEKMSLSGGCSNRSHAEIQFLNWIKGHLKQYPDFANRINTIHLYLNYSPCSKCNPELVSFVRQNNLQNKFKIKWQKVYIDKGGCGHSTTNTAIQSLKQNGIACDHCKS